eukprot:4076874-Pleurochrysis_carterae.AAC.7
MLGAADHRCAERLLPACQQRLVRRRGPRRTSERNVAATADSPRPEHTPEPPRHLEVVQKLPDALRLRVRDPDLALEVEQVRRMAKNAVRQHFGDESIEPRRACLAGRKRKHVARDQDKVPETKAHQLAPHRPSTRGRRCSCCLLRRWHLRNNLRQRDFVNYRIPARELGAARLLLLEKLQLKELARQAYPNRRGESSGGSKAKRGASASQEAGRGRPACAASRDEAGTADSAAATALSGVLCPGKTCRNSAWAVAFGFCLGHDSRPLRLFFSATSISALQGSGSAIASSEVGHAREYCATSLSFTSMFTLAVYQAELLYCFVGRSVEMMSEKEEKGEPMNAPTLAPTSMSSTPSRSS